jgi:hypothetical protein
MNLFIFLFEKAAKGMALKYEIFFSLFGLAIFAPAAVILNYHVGMAVAGWVIFWLLSIWVDIALAWTKSKKGGKLLVSWQFANGDEFLQVAAWHVTRYLVYAAIVAILMTVLQGGELTSQERISILASYAGIALVVRWLRFYMPASWAVPQSAG